MELADFFAWDETQDEAHEYVDGEIVAVPNEAPRHHAITARVQASLALAGDYTVLAGQRIAAVPGSRYYYADASVVSGEIALEPGTDAMVNPSVLVEVLSRATEVRDRGDTRRSCMRITALQEYILVSQSRPLIERYWRYENGWMYRAYEAGESVTLSTGHVLSVDALYARVMNIAGENP
jgi:Uma2 family endonuclease